MVVHSIVGELKVHHVTNCGTDNAHTGRYANRDLEAKNHTRVYSKHRYLFFIRDTT